MCHFANATKLDQIRSKDTIFFDLLRSTYIRFSLGMISISLNADHVTCWVAPINDSQRNDHRADLGEGQNSYIVELI